MHKEHHQESLTDIQFICKQKGYKRSKKNSIKAALSPSFICTSIFRLSSFLHKTNTPILPRLFWWINFIIFKVDIDQRATISGAIYLPHPMMITIGSEVRIHGNCKIMQGVTIGGNLGRESSDGQRQPILHGNCFLGINSLLTGPITLQGPIFVAALSVVSDDAKSCVIYETNKTTQLRERHLEELKTK